jgi:hypothetical protein
MEPLMKWGVALTIIGATIFIIGSLAIVTPTNMSMDENWEVTGNVPVPVNHFPILGWLTPIGFGLMLFGMVMTIHAYEYLMIVKEI